MVERLYSRCKIGSEMIRSSLWGMGLSPVVSISHGMSVWVVLSLLMWRCCLHLSFFFLRGSGSMSVCQARRREAERASRSSPMSSCESLKEPGCSRLFPCLCQIWFVSPHRMLQWKIDFCSSV
ncbi:hypothetical protein MPTK1_2g04060 [Marchantia polymorpha subsp. ruderalis]|uniref:Uncharacterized protein n=1 Tax=Marchantia polymorpha TaxID=3197 RepID=A0A2R6X7L3_MARPO|nr:hypothetical protein MARPO_0031s0062 [Marchantia polymorpha]BBN01034.1 hypothetical protein Mp_2g04060 [Marchantia polymorpha subsp. ruderalis]|eukprot:PTQ42083.1 hypothetical protein MARPO_0031s0062 [Marchantia polymorpha]